MLQRLFLSGLLMMLLLSCWSKLDRDRMVPKKVLGYKPVYSKDSSILRISAEAAKPVKNAGKIYVMGNLIFQNELGEGIHVLDNTDPSQIKKLGFIRVKGNSEMSIKGKFLYVNSFTDLVIVDITDWQQPKEVRRLQNVFRQGSSVPGGYQFIPLPEHNVYFDCTGFQQGFQTGWVKDTILDVNCFYP